MGIMLRNLQDRRSKEHLFQNTANGFLKFQLKGDFYKKDYTAIPSS